MSRPVGFAVVRFPQRWLTLGLVPAGLEGRWFEVPDPRDLGPALENAEAVELRVSGQAVARPIGTFETREDGAVAEVWRVEELAER